MKQLQQNYRKIQQIYQADKELKQKGAIYEENDLHGRIWWIGEYLSKIGYGDSCRIFIICEICLSQMNSLQHVYIYYLNTKYVGSFNVCLQSSFKIGFHTFSQRLKSTFLPLYSQKHQKYLLQTLILSPLTHPQVRQVQIQLEIFSPSTILLALLSLSFKSRSLPWPMILSGTSKKEYLALICGYLSVLMVSSLNKQPCPSLTRLLFFVLIDAKNCNIVLESQVQLTDQSYQSYYQFFKIRIDI